MCRVTKTDENKRNKMRNNIIRVDSDVIREIQETMKQKNKQNSGGTFCDSKKIKK